MSSLYQTGYKWGRIYVRDEIKLHGIAHAMYTIKHYISGMIGLPALTDRQDGLIDGILDSVEGM